MGSLVHQWQRFMLLILARCLANTLHIKNRHDLLRENHIASACKSTYSDHKERYVSFKIASACITAHKESGNDDSVSEEGKG